jgi:hypothetical protein
MIVQRQNHALVVAQRFLLSTKPHIYEQNLFVKQVPEEEITRNAGRGLRAKCNVIKVYQGEIT